MLGTEVISFLLGAGFVVSLFLLALAAGSNWSDNKKIKRTEEAMKRQKRMRELNIEKELDTPIKWEPPIYDYLDPSKLNVRHEVSKEVL